MLEVGQDSHCLNEFNEQTWPISTTDNKKTEITVDLLVFQGFGSASDWTNRLNADLKHFYICTET